jgi:transposase
MATPRNVTTLEGIEVVGMSKIEAVTFVKARYAEDRDNYDECPRCGIDDPKLYAKEWVNRHLKDRPVDAGPLKIELECLRYECQDCKRTFQSQHDQIRPSSSLTKALIHHISRRSRGHETHAEIARRTGVHESTVRKYFPGSPRTLRTSRLPTTAMGIDEAHVGTGRPSLLITSISTSGGADQVIEVLEDDRKDTLRTYFNRLHDDFEFQGREEGLTVVIDMTSHFKNAIHESDFDATVVVDRFHVAKRANLALGNTYQRLLVTDTLEEQWKRRKAELEGLELKGGVQKTIGDELDRMEMAYKLGMWFRSIYDHSSDREDAAERFRHWEKSIPDSMNKDYEDVTRPLDNWWDEILNYFDHPYTNAYNEAMNLVTKSLERKSAGYSHETLRTKLISGNVLRPQHELDLFAGGPLGIYGQPLPRHA